MSLQFFLFEGYIKKLKDLSGPKLYKHMSLSSAFAKGTVTTCLPARCGLMVIVFRTPWSKCTKTRPASTALITYPFIQR